jgi:hypothetical protein
MTADGCSAHAAYSTTAGTQAAARPKAALLAAMLEDCPALQRSKGVRPRFWVKISNFLCEWNPRSRLPSLRRRTPLGTIFLKTG